MFKLVFGCGFIKRNSSPLIDAGRQVAHRRWKKGVLKERLIGAAASWRRYICDAAQREQRIPDIPTLRCPVVVGGSPVSSAPIQKPG
ncbi:hypothetical protein BDD12DRAFT_840661 [Trichophaea hybrida]|nr:hypothetical protein BDD12DRAFT_840661 [Trichophaea hybrida]